MVTIAEVARRAGVSPPTGRRRLLVSLIGVCLLLTTAAACSASGSAHGSASGSVHDAAVAPSNAATPTTKPMTGTPAASSATLSSSAAVATTTTPPSATSTSRSPASGAPLAGRIRPGTVYQGVATAYDAGSGTGACLYDPTTDPMIAAMNVTDYESAQACGATVLIKAGNGKSITVRIVNECPGSCAPGQIDLSQQAFARLADLKVGRLPISWSLQSPDTTAPISIRYKTGSSKWWCGIQVIGHRNPVALLEIRAGGAWRRLSRADYNYFISADGTGCGGQIRVTDIYGEQLVISGIALSPNVAQRTTVQFARH